MSKAEKRYSKRRNRRKNKMILLGAASGLACAALVFAVVWAVFLRDGESIGGVKSEGLTGTWSIDGVTIYRFEDKGKGKMCLPTDEYTFKYTENGDRISIDFDDPECVDRTYTLKLDGDRLTLIRDDDEAYEFTRIG